MSPAFTPGARWTAAPMFSIGAAGLRVAGAGSVWSVTAGDDGVVVRSITG